MPLRDGAKARVARVLPLDPPFELVDPLVELLPLGAAGVRGFLEKLGLFEEDRDHLVAFGSSAMSSSIRSCKASSW